MNRAAISSFYNPLSSKMFNLAGPNKSYLTMTPEKCQTMREVCKINLTYKSKNIKNDFDIEQTIR